MFRPVMFSIFSICTLYLLGKVYHTLRPTNQYGLCLDVAIIAQLLLRTPTFHLCYFACKLPCDFGYAI